MKNCLLLLFSAFTFLNSYAQESEKKDVFHTTIRYHYGAVLPHHKSIHYLVNDQIAALELNFGILPSINRSWSKMYNQPEIGIGFYRGSLGNDKVLGNTNALFPYINFNLKDYRKGNLRLQTGFGVAHTKKHFHPSENYTNVAIGSKLNAFFKLLLSSSYQIGKQWSANVGIGFQHLSNGSINVPNKGLNMATANIGIQYHFNEIERQVKSPATYSKLDNELTIIFSGGLKQTTEIDENKYFASSLSSNYAFGINSKQRIGFGIDIFYDEGANRGDWNFSPATSFQDRLSQALYVSHDLVIQKFSLITHIGVYALYKTDPEKPIYSRVGLRYNVSNKIVANLSLKAHLGKADFIEWGIGYRFNMKKND
ncbi:acyloxyacyl hydrolase [Marinifilum caeruleilacunae]|uniref:Acyloxyacyl hydrolase n=1 Tax=Marinifilum caeruleilacunae TaxID=2499076 RepID=A0ABX1WTQ8_9BACT|nr:acyloxyacyl hydrolase [Marinifilum caeruleilacunae]NOU59486.1 acyloxyacyl hydrolase [Marinifilum caeruleilacunae]